MINLVYFKVSDIQSYDNWKTFPYSCKDYDFLQKLINELNSFQRIHLYTLQSLLRYQRFEIDIKNHDITFQWNSNNIVSFKNNEFFVIFLFEKAELVVILFLLRGDFNEWKK